jgi:hypothetical protein
MDVLMVDFEEDELKRLQDPKRTPAWGWFVSDGVKSC